MLKKILLAALATGAMALNAPAALAADPTYDCNFNSVQQEDVTGQNYEGVVWGYVADPEGREVAVKCAIEVNGTEVSSSPTGTGTGVAATSGRVTFAAAPTDTVRLCITVWINGQEWLKICFETTYTQIPPQAVIDAINTLFYDYIDPLLCPRLVLVAGTYGPIVVNGQGDIYIDGEPFWDCPPYDIWPPE